MLIIIFFVSSLLITLLKIIINEIDCAIIVAIPIPFMPKAGINKKPKIKIGFKSIFKRNYIIRAFL